MRYCILIIILTFSTWIYAQRPDIAIESITVEEQFFEIEVIELNRVICDSCWFIASQMCKGRCSGRYLRCGNALILLKAHNIALTRVGLSNMLSRMIQKVGVSLCSYLLLPDKDENTFTFRQLGGQKQVSLMCKIKKDEV